jgi:hypothetical protein
LQYIQQNIARANATPTPGLSLNQTIGFTSGNPFTGSIVIAPSPNGTPRNIAVNNTTTGTITGTTRPVPSERPPRGTIGPTPSNLSLNQIVGNTVGNIFSGTQLQNLTNQINNVLSNIPTTITQTQRTPSPRPRTATTTTAAGSISLNQAIGNTSGSNPFANSAANAQLTQIINERIAVNQEIARINEAAAQAAAQTTASQYSCRSGYILKQNEFGANFCQEDPSLLNTQEWRVRCDESGCQKCTTGFFAVCYRLETVEAIAPTAPIAVSNKKPLGQSCSSGSECNSGTCSSSWIESNGSRSVSLTGNKCVYSEAQQVAFVNADAQRQTDTVRLTAAGLGLASAPYALTNIYNAVELTAVRALTGSLPAAGTATLNVVNNVVSAATVGSLTYGAGDCAFGYAGGNACRVAGEIALTGYTQDPTGFAQMFRQVGQIPALTSNTIAAVRNLRNTANVADDLGLEAGYLYNMDGTVSNIRPSSNVIDLSFVDDGANAVRNTVPVLNSGINNSINTGISPALQFSGGTQLINPSVLPALSQTSVSLLPTQLALMNAVTNNITNSVVTTGINTLTQTQIRNATNTTINSGGTSVFTPGSNLPISQTGSNQITIPSTGNSGLSYTPPTFTDPANQLPVLTTNTSTITTPSQNTSILAPISNAVNQITTNIGTTINNITGTNIIPITLPTNPVQTLPITPSAPVAELIPGSVTTPQNTTPNEINPLAPIPPNYLANLPPPPTTSTETIRRVELVVERTDNYLDSVIGEPNDFGCRSGICDLSASYVSTASYEVGLIPRVYGVEELNALRGISVDNTFGHYITVLENPATGDMYLIDRTFNQFVDPDTLAIRNTNNNRFISSGDLDTHPLAEEIIDTGYVRLTDQTLNEYLDMVSNAPPQRPISLSQLDDAKPYIERPYTPQEINNLTPELADLRSVATTPPANPLVRAITEIVKTPENIVNNIVGALDDAFSVAPAATTAQVERITSQVDEVLTNNFPTGGNDFGCRSEYCVQSANFAVSLGREQGLIANVYNVENLNAARGIPTSQSFNHRIAILSDGTNSYLVDPTFVQFVDPITGAITQSSTYNGNIVNSGFGSNHPIVQQLQQNGYIPLTNQTLNAYLDITTNSLVRPIAGLEIIENTPARNALIYTLDEITNYKYEGLFEVFKMLERQTPGTLQSMDELGNLVDMNGNIIEPVQTTAVPNSLAVPETAPRNLTDRILDPIRNLIKPAPPVESGMIRYAQDTNIPQLVETGQTPLTTQIRETVENAINRVTGFFRPQPPATPIISPTQQAANNQIRDTMESQLVRSNVPVTVSRPTRGSTVSIEVRELPGGISDPVVTFNASTSPASTVNSIIPNQIGPASRSTGIVPVINSINPSSPNMVQILDAFESSVTRNGMDTIVAVNITPQTYDYLLNRGFTPPTDWPSGSNLPPAMVKNISANQDNPLRGTVGDIPGVVTQNPTAPAVQDGIDQVSMQKLPNETMEEYFARMNRINASQIKPETISRLNTNIIPYEPQTVFTIPGQPVLSYPLQIVGNTATDATGRIIELVDDIALGWFKPTDLANPKGNFLPEPVIPQLQFGKVPLDTNFESGVKTYPIKQNDQRITDQVLVKPGDMITTSGSRVNEDSFQLPNDGSLVFFKDDLGNYISTRANIYYSASSSPVGEIELVKLPTEGMVFNTTDYVDIYHVDSVNGQAFKLGQVSKPQNYQITITRDPNAVYYDPNLEFVTNGVTTVLESPGQVILSGLAERDPWPIIISDSVIAFERIINELRGGALPISVTNEPITLPIPPSELPKPGETLIKFESNLDAPQLQGNNQGPTAIARVLTPIVDAYEGFANAVSRVLSNPLSPNDEINTYEGIFGFLKPKSSGGFQSMVNTVDKAVELERGPRKIGCRQFGCGFAADLVTYQANQNSYSAFKYNVKDLNAARGVPLSNSEAHAFSIVEANGGRYIVDLSFVQFMDYSSSSPVAISLLNDGFVPLTDTTLNEYLNLLTSDPNPAYAGTNLLKQVKPGKVSVSGADKRLLKQAEELTGSNMQTYQTVVDFPTLTTSQETPISQTIKDWLEKIRRQTPTTSTPPITAPNTTPDTEIISLSKPGHPQNPSSATSENARQYVINRAPLSTALTDAETGEIIDSYQILLDRARQTMINEGKTPLEAVVSELRMVKPIDYREIGREMDLIINERGLSPFEAYEEVANRLISPFDRAVLEKRMQEKIAEGATREEAMNYIFTHKEQVRELDDIGLAFKGDNSISGRVLCKTRIDCLEMPYLQENLLSDLGETEPYSLIVGFGGTEGNADFPYRHGALLVGDQVVGFNLREYSAAKFQTMANILSWGEFGLKLTFPEAAENAAQLAYAMSVINGKSATISPPTFTEKLTEKAVMFYSEDLPVIISRSKQRVSHWFQDNVRSNNGQWFPNLRPNITTELTTPPPSGKMLELVKSVDEAINIKSGPRNISCRKNLCGEASTLVFYEGNTNLGIKVDTYNAYDLNIARGIPENETPSHLFSIAADESGQKFIVDLSVSQYVTEATTDPVILELFDQGLIPLNQINLNTYLDFIADSKKGTTTGLEILTKVPPRPTTVTDSQKALLETAGKSVVNNSAPTAKVALSNESIDRYADETINAIEEVYPPGDYCRMRPRILSGNTSDVVGKCGYGGSVEVAEKLSERINSNVYSATSNHPDTSGHAYLADPVTDIIIDPTAGQFIPPASRVGFETYFRGNMFIGPRDVLREVALKGVINTRTQNDPELSFQRIWGDESKYLK